MRRCGAESPIALTDGELAMHATLPLMRDSDFPAIRRKRLETLQVNLGYKCNQSCVHCHVNAGPTRTEMMTRETVNDATLGGWLLSVP